MAESWRNSGLGLDPLIGVGPATLPKVRQRITQWPSFEPAAPVLVPTPTFNGADNKDRQETVAAEGAVIPLVYGRQRLGARIAGAVIANYVLHLIAVWCEGPVTSIESVTVDDQTPDAGISFTHYTGTAGQTVNSDLVTAYAANGITFADAMPYTCYSVVKVPFGISSGFPRLAAVIKGFAVYDPRGPSTAWSANPALALADFITNTRYGLGLGVDWSSVETAADACDEVVGTAPRRESHLAIDRAQEARKWLDVLRGYAACYLTGEGDPYVMVPDRPAASVLTFTAADIVQNSMRLAKRGVMNAPTVVTLSYTDSSEVPWRQQTARAYAAGVLEGTTPWRESRVSMPGIMSYAQAYREAVERLNALQLNDLSAKWVAFDEGIKAQVGDVVTVTHPLGLTSKLMRVTGLRDQGFGRYEISAQEYDEAVYSDAVAGGPTYVDTTLGNPLLAPTITGISLSEDVYYISSGYYASRIRATWTDAQWAFLVGYRVEVWNGSTLVQSDTVQSAEYTTPPVAEGQSYTLRVSAYSLLVVGAASTASLTVSGKNTAPSDVSGFAAQAIAQLVLLSWTPASDLDLTAHEIRYWPSGGSWATGTLLDRVAMPATRYTTQVIPPGEWIIGIKGLDSVRNATYPNGQPSANAVTAVVTVTTDPNNLLLGDHTYTTPTLTNMVARTAGGITYWVTDFGDTWSSLFTTTMSTYTNPVASYHTSGTASLVTESFDMGAEVSGTWIGAMDYTALAGTPNFYLELSLNNTDWTQYVGGSANATGRYARLRIETTTTGAVRVDSLGTLTVSAVTRSEVQQGITSAASGPTIVTLSEAFTKYKQVVISPVNVTSARSWVVDKVETSGGRGLGANKVLRFDGSTGYVSVPHIAAYALSTFTIEAWVKVATDTTKPCRLVAKGDTADATATYWELRLTSLGRFYFGRLEGATQEYVNTNQQGFHDGAWHHVAGVLDSGTTLRLFVDGVLIGSASVSGYVQPLGDLGIGALPPTVSGGAWSSFAKAHIDDVRLWNTARSASEIADNMFTALTGSETGLVGYWRLDSASGTTATDSTSAANHGTVTGSAWWRPYDGFDFYVFNSSGTQVAQECDVRFEGV